MRRAQIQGQIFIYIMGIVVAGLVLLLGIRFVGTMLDNQDKILYSKFVNGVSDSVSTTTFRSVDQEEYKLPDKYVEVCFVDYSVDGGTFAQADADTGNFIQSNHAVIYDEMNTRQNPATAKAEIIEANTDMFLFDSKGAVSSESVGKVKLDHPYYNCIKIVDGYVKLEFEGVKGGVKVSEWE